MLSTSAFTRSPLSSCCGSTRSSACRVLLSGFRRFRRGFVRFIAPARHKRVKSHATRHSMASARVSLDDALRGTRESLLEWSDVSKGRRQPRSGQGAQSVHSAVPSCGKSNRAPLRHAGEGKAPAAPAARLGCAAWVCPAGWAGHCQCPPPAAPVICTACPVLRRRAVATSQAKPNCSARLALYSFCCYRVFRGSGYCFSLQGPAADFSGALRWIL